MTNEPNLISSSDNPKIKTLKKLQLKKYRDKLKKFVVENPLTIRDGLRHGARLQELYVTEAFAENNTELYKKIVSQTENAPTFVDERVLQSASFLDKSQGIIAVYAVSEFDIDMSQSVMLLLGVSDPGNVGTILRSAAAFGISQVVLDTDSADIYNPKTISAAKEAIFVVNTVRKESSYIGELHKKLPLFGLDMTGSVSVNEAEWSQPLCLVLGSEAHGIPEELASHIDTFVSIPMAADTVESLNVAASAAITLQQMFSKSK